MKTRTSTLCHAARLRSPLGAYFAVVQEDGALVALEFAKTPKRQLNRSVLGQQLARHGLELDWNEDALAEVDDQLTRYFDGELERFELRTKPRGTPFQRRVWKALERIPFGRTLSYAQLAKRVGHTGAFRAVGAANGSNPISIVIPCHRVIGSSGKLTGYGGGLERKRALLELEGCDVSV